MRKHYYAYELCIRKTRNAKALRMGTVIHEGLDKMAQGETPEAAIAAVTQQYETLPLNEAQYDWDIERETVIVLLWAYSEYWKTFGAKYIATETPFSLKIINPDTGASSRVFIQQGKRDKIITYNGRTLLMEHKTTSDSIEPESDYWQKLRLDNQISMYYAACQSEGIDVAGCLYDVIRKPALSPKQIPLLDENGIKVVNDSNGNRVLLANGKPRQTGDTALGYTLVTRQETPREFAERLTADVASRPAYYFARREIPRLDADIVEFQQELWQTAQLVLDRQNAAKKLESKGINPACAWPRNSHSCMTYGKCQYFDICACGMDLRTDIPEGFEKLSTAHPELEQSK
jgi:hypothetical protein